MEKNNLTTHDLEIALEQLCFRYDNIQGWVSDEELEELYGVIEKIRNIIAERKSK